jgi:uncharacterized protein YfaS (alpha-2-macroglobulin family)
MRSSRPTPGLRRKTNYFISIITIIMLISLVWSVAGCSKATPTAATSTVIVEATQLPDTPTPTPTPLPATQPPALVETDPLPGSQIALQNPITFYFNQPMQRASVEAAVTGVPALLGKFTWKDDSSLTFTPNSPIIPGSSQVINIGTSAQSKKGMALQAPISLSFTTSTYLTMLQSLPEADASDVDPTSAVVATFNQPVVALGADQASLPDGFSLEPAAQGHGEWINTSTYIFYPEPALAGGISYQVTINEDLVGTAGAPLEITPTWSFTTVLPRLVSVTPNANTMIGLDASIQLNFSYSMDAGSVESNFSLQSSDGTVVRGRTGWNTDFTTFVFTPTNLLQRDTLYTAMLDAQAAALGGTPLDASYQNSWPTVPDLAVTNSAPAEGGMKNTYDSLIIYLSSIIPDKNLLDYVTVSPEVANLGGWWNVDDMSLMLYATFEPSTDYTVTLSPNLTDLWGSRLGETFNLHFRTAALDPSIQFPYTSDASFLTTQDAGVMAVVTNLPYVPLSMGTLAIDDLVQMYGDDGYTYRQNFVPSDVLYWTDHLELPSNQATTVTLNIPKEGRFSQPGLYFLRVEQPDMWGYTNSMILAISHYQTTLKLSPTQAFVWAVDLDTNAPAANLPVTVFNQAGTPLVSGTTNGSGVFEGDITSYLDLYNSSFAILGQPGEDNFGFALSYWNDGVNPWDFDLTANYYPSGTYAYIYTDRPIYRPGDTVYYRVIVRKVSNGRYTLPDLNTYSLTLYQPGDNESLIFDVPLSGFGTGKGEYTLPEDTIPGDYYLDNVHDGAYGSFKVADYRKPEINVQVAFQSTDVLSGTQLAAQINARYFFDAPAGNLSAHWALYRQTANFNLTHYQVGPVDTSWLNVTNFNFGMYGLGELIVEGDVQTDANGLANVTTPAPAYPGRQQYTLEVTLTDESKQPVSARDTVYVNPAEYYIGIHPDSWSYQAGNEAGFSALVADWDGDPAGTRSLSAQFQRVEWVRHDPENNDLGYIFPTYTAEYTPIASADVTTAAEGTARLTFTPPDPGTYQLDVSGGGTLTQVIIWVGGKGQAIWPSLPNQRLRLVADKDSYKAGDSAQIFIPNPFGNTTMGLLTVERGEVLRYQILQLEPGGSTVPLALTNDEAPNVYIGVTLIGKDSQGNADFRQGYINLLVDASFEFLNVTLTSQPERSGPGEPVTFNIHITDANGSPVQGEFSLAVVDKAVLALADPTEKAISAGFYGIQPLNVRTGISLAASGLRLRYMPGGMGGGGGGEVAESVTRENFPDTAYWDAQLVTDASGNASVSMNLPDNLTTWQVLVRGVTMDTLVGEAKLDLVTTQDLLIRPLAPRFLVAGDHVLLAAVVQNNTPNAMQGNASLQSDGFVLDDPNSITQAVSLPANGRQRMEWWGTAENVASASLRFSVQAGGLQDAVLLSNGALPVLRYTAPQTFATAGSLSEAGERLELVSLPVTFDASSGSLEVELDPSLAAAMLDSLDALEYHPSDYPEQVLSSFLPNLVTYTTLQSFAIDSPDLKSRLDRSLSQGLEQLLALQNADGGWGWWQTEQSDAYLTAYVLFGLATTRDAGYSVPENVISNAVSYLSGALVTPSQDTESWVLDRLAFENFALKSAGAGNLDNANQLYAVRDQLNPWSNALLTLSMDLLSSSSNQVPTLMSDLQATAIRSATGVHWELKNTGWSNMTSTLSNTAMVVYTLAKLEPTSTLIPDAVNYLMSNRQAGGFWNSTYETSWILLAMNEVMKGTGELSSTYGFSASLNNSSIASGQAGDVAQLNLVITSLPLSSLYPNDPNALVIQRDAGTGRLYYTAALNVYRPADEIAPLNRGISVNRAYYEQGADVKTATPVNNTRVGEVLTVRLTIILPNDAYHFAVEDYIPAGTEILNTNLKTSQLGINGEPAPLYDPRDPYSNGWGWWLFNPARIYDDHITWTASYLPAGTYDLTYTLTIVQAGEYQILPARAWMSYFPEVQGNSAGGMLVIKP